MSGQYDRVAEPSSQDKCDSERDSELLKDSGFLSGRVSEIYSGEDLAYEDYDQQSADPSPQDQDDDSKMLKETNECFDSGLGISASLSNLCLQKPDTNNLSCEGPVRHTPVADAPKTEIWQKYYEQDQDGDTHLHLAILCGHRVIIEPLIKIAPHPKLLDTPNDDAQTPLHLAVELNVYHVVRQLVVAGAKINPRDGRGDAPLHIAARHGHTKCVEALLTPVQKIERDLLGLSYAHPLNCDTDLNQWNNYGQTCVHVAAQYGHIDVLRQLYNFGANINAREGCMGYTALHIAVDRRDEPMARFLLEECPKLDPHTTTYGRRSALQLSQFVPEALGRILQRHDISPYCSEDEDETDSDDDMYELPSFPVSKMVGASA